VFSVDEKSQRQALDRAQPGLPLKKGHCGTMTHDNKHHCTTFAALDIASGKVIGECMPRHRHQEWLKCPRRIDAEMPKHLDVHLIADNYATHKHTRVRAWLKRHPRFHRHFTPTSASWLNQVERFFGLITADRIRCVSTASPNWSMPSTNTWSTTMPIQSPSSGLLPPSQSPKKWPGGGKR
jgi:transposase